ncbi:hypothetical protein KJ763_01555 [Patescibacteria group bacterium]|nr:hypothetical protein [Patescibacteria group bacterium]
MLYFFYGQDSFRSRQKINELLEFFRSQKQNSETFRINAENFDTEEFEGLLKSESLFGNKNIIIGTNLLTNKIVSSLILKNLERFRDSKNVFLFLEKEIDDDYLEKIKDNAEKIQKFDLLTGVKLKKWVEDEIDKRKIKLTASLQEKILEKCNSDLWCVFSEIEKYELSEGQTFADYEGLTFVKKYNPFQICDAITFRDRKNSWILLQKGLLNGVSAEEVFWKVWWQIKVLLLVKNQPQGLNLNPFVIKKSLNGAKNFTQDELKNLSWQMVNLYHQVRNGQAEFEPGLEKILISL